jgi:hypothetical protein
MNSRKRQPTSSWAAAACRLHPRPAGGTLLVILEESDVQCVWARRVDELACPPLPLIEERQVWSNNHPSDSTGAQWRSHVVGIYPIGPSSSAPSLPPCTLHWYHVPRRALSRASTWHLIDQEERCLGQRELGTEITQA